MYSAGNSSIRRIRRLLVGPALAVALFGGSAALAASANAAVPAAGPGYGPTSTVPSSNTLPPENAVPATPTNPPSGGIAFTGTDALATTAVGAGAIGLGGILVLSSRKRRRNNFNL